MVGALSIDTMMIYLMLFFDDLLEDHAGCVRRIARFIGVDCDEDTLTRVVRTTIHEEMAHHHKKSPKSLGTPCHQRMNMFKGCVTMEEDQVMDNSYLLKSNCTCIDQLWLKIVTPKLGFGNLHEMREALHKEHLYMSIKE